MSEDPRTRPGFRLRLALAWFVVAVERIWPAVWPAVAVLGLFLAVSLLGLWQRLPPVVHALGLLAFAGLLVLALWYARRELRLPGREEALARLEADSRIPHQALRGLEDRLPDEIADPQTRLLWEAHRARLARLVRRLALHPPRSALPARDPWALRAALLLLLVVALVDARGEYGARLRAAFAFAESERAAAPAVSAGLWVTPPAYTRRPPLGAEQTAREERLLVPVGSALLAQLHHVPPDADVKSAKLLLPTGEEARFADLGSGSAEARATLEGSGRLAILAPDGRTIASWIVEAIPDLAPKVAFVDEPAVTHRGVLRIGYEAEDDYGVSEIALELATTTLLEERERLPLAKLQPRPGKHASAVYSDLLAHPFAGLEVEMRLLATDSIGQEGASGPLRLVLPERRFRNPLARAVIDQRKALVARPEQREQVAGRLAALAESEAALAHGAAVPLALRVAALRTRDAETRERRRAAIDLLWEIALFIEDGALSQAERELRALQERLERALAEQASDAELERLLAELQDALDRFLEELARQALAEMQDPAAQREPMQPVDPGRLVDRQDLQRMLDRARELMRAGQREAARQMLQQLREMLENLQVARGQQRPTAEQKMLSDLQKMIELQRDLLDRSHRMQQGMSGEGAQQRPRDAQGRQGQQGREGQRAQRQPGQRGPTGQRGPMGQGEPMQGGEAENALPDSPGRAASEQEGLRRALGELMRRMGERGMPIPRELGQAELEMRAARDALGEGDPGRAAPNQAQALELLQQGGQAMLEQMQQQLGQDQGPGPGREPLAQGRRSRDPLGRSQFNDGGWDTRGELVPEEADLGRAREVLEELYRRSGERHRPALELDYYKRLLDRF